MNGGVQVDVPLAEMNQTSPVDPNPAPKVKLPPHVKRGVAIIGSLVGGGAIGYIGYWLTRLVVKLTGSGGAAINPIGYVLAGVVYAAIIETARLASDVAMNILGDRQKFENLADPDNATTMDRFRQRTWKVISRVEGVEQDIDVVFSRTFNIRTAKEIRDQDIQDRQLYFMEVVRRAFFVGLSSVTTLIPQQMSFQFVGAMGWTILGGELFAWVPVLVFISGFTNSINEVYMRKDAEERADARKRWRELELRPSCEIVAAMNDPIYA